MNGKCSQPDCGVKEGLTCELGHFELIDCPHFVKNTDETQPPQAGLLHSEPFGHRLPWSGRALGLSDMMIASARSSPTLVGLIGPYNAGKTAFLTSLFVHFAETAQIGRFSFAGSYTLQAWSHLKHYTTWPANQESSFPPHTPDSADRVPSLLHLAFREDVQPIQDVLFTDAPGEWFTRWIKNHAAEDAGGARWIAEHSTHFLFFVDREALAGTDVGKTRQQILALARLLSEQRGNRPVFVIWAKSDLKGAPEVEDMVRQKLQKFFGDHQSFEVHVEDPECLKVLGLILEPPKTTPAVIRRLSPEMGSAFFAYEGDVQ
jgi:hypothetical protein